VPSRPAIALLAVATAAALLSGCASFAAQAGPATWSDPPDIKPVKPPQPEVPGMRDDLVPQDPNRRGPQTPVPPPDGCIDHHPAVIATCLDMVAAVAAIPGTDADPQGLAAERRTGKVLRVHKGEKAQVVITLPVDATGDGGLTGLALSPSYQEDHLVFAYVTTPTDNRVVRFAANDKPKPILTGIPRGATGNRGGLDVDATGNLLVVTGNAGNPANAGNAGSLAGKILRITTSGQPAPGNPTPGNAVIASGLHAPGGICTNPSGAIWVTDRAPEADLLYKVSLGQPLGAAAWRWPEKPGVSGCAAWSNAVSVGTSVAGDLRSLALHKDGSFDGAPKTIMDKDGYGRLGAIDRINDAVALVGTVNKDGGKPISSDDRTAIIVRDPTGSDSGKD
jgi:glucose/arabinose dehydrogenase